MSLIVDTKYLLLLSPKLLGFKKKTESLWNFRCPYCHDSKKKDNKARGYVYRKNNDLFYKCHNCSKGTTMSNFVKYLDPILHKEYVLERFVSGDNHPNHNYKKPILLSSSTKDHFQKKSVDYGIVGLESIASLDTKHWVRMYVENRAIPQEHFDKLFFAPDFKAFAELYDPQKSAGLKAKEPRLVIPFFDSDGKFVAFQGRSLEGSTVRYITIKIKEEYEKIYGLERLNTNNRVWIFEGPIDSLFVRNSIAASGAELQKLIGRYKSSVFVFDNEPSNKEIVENMRRVIDSGNQIIIWDKSIKEKDVNDMVLADMDIERILDNSVCSGLEAKFKFNIWKRV